MRGDLGRRQLFTAAFFTSMLPLRAWAQAGGALVIEDRTFTGTRLATSSGGAGGEGLRAKPGNIIRRCRFLDLGNGAVRINIPTDGLIIEDCEANNVYRFLEDTSSNSGSPAVLSNFALRRLVGRDIDHGMSRIRYDSNNGTIEDVIAFGGAQADLYCVGFQLDDTAHSITYLRTEAHDFRENGRASNAYWNGDGFSDERGNKAIRYISCTATNCTDGGFDLKSSDMFLENCVARGNKRNYRLWSSGQLLGCRSENPKLWGGTGGAAHFSFHGEAGRFVIDRPIVRADVNNSAPVFLIETTVPLTLEIINADIDAPAAPLIAVKGPEPSITWKPNRAAQNIRVLRERI